MILIVVQCYVTEKMRYANGFVHARVKEYKQNQIESEVFVLQKKNGKDYNIDGINVMVGNRRRLEKYIEDNKKITSICFHFFNPYMSKVINQIERKIPIFIFVHGNEALHWYQRIFPDRLRGVIRILKFVKYMIVNTYSIFKIKRFFHRTNKKIEIVCVSEWMKDVTVKNWNLDTQKYKIHIIPNVVNEKLFKYEEKNPNMRYNILMIRNFNSGKYALDIAMKTIIKLSKYPDFKKFNIRIFGDGWLYEKYTNSLKQFKNVELNRMLLSQEQISQEHKKSGIFLCPTRQDAQGVSMCEAMSSGLIPITSNNTAIPEFLPDEYQLSFKRPEELANRIIEIANNSEEFTQLSEKVSRFINKKCSTSETTEKEINLIKSKCKRINL